MFLHYLAKLKIEIVCKYAADIEDKMLSYRTETALQGALDLAKSKRLTIILRTL